MKNLESERRLKIKKQNKNKDHKKRHIKKKHSAINGSNNGATQHEKIKTYLNKSDSGYSIIIPDEIIEILALADKQKFILSISIDGKLILDPIEKERSRFYHIMDSLDQINKAEYRTIADTYIDPSTVSLNDIDFASLDDLSAENRSEIIEKLANEQLVNKMSLSNRFRESIVRLWSRNGEKYKVKYYIEFNEIIDNNTAKLFYQENKKSILKKILLFIKRK